MIKVKFNIDFSKIRNILKDGRLTNRLNKEIAPKIAKESAKFIRQGKVIPELKELTINVKKKEGSSTPKTPLMMTGKLVNSLKGNKEGIRGVSYAKKHREGEYTWKEKTSYKVLENPIVPGVNLEPRKREFIVAKSDGEYLTSSRVSDKIYKEFEKKFVKLLSKSIRKR